MTAKDQPPAPPPCHRRAAGVFTFSFLALLGSLLLASRELFTRVIYEEGDFAANSIIIDQAKHFDLLVGNYSRVGLSHPGPAFFYVQAAGEWLLHDVLGVVPSPYNGQAIGILAVNAACVALVLTILYTWLRSLPAVLAAAGVILAFAAAHDQLLSSTWMPFVYFAPFLLLLVAAASVAAGRLAHLWLLVLAGGLLVHGHASFLYFVPLIALGALAMRWRTLRREPRAWLGAAGVLAVFLLPIVLNLVLHWPGEFPRYFGYGNRREGHAPLDAARYQLQFWAGPPGLALAVAIGLFLGVRAVARRCAPPLLRSGVRITALATVLFFGYASYGIDTLTEPYIGYFSWAIPLALLVFGVAGLVLLAPTTGRWRDAVPALAGATLAAGLVAAGLSGTLANRRGEVPGVPAALDAMAGRAGGRPIVLELRQHDAWPEAVPLVIAGLRRGERVCLADPSWRLIVTERFVCTGAELAAGARFAVSRRTHTPPEEPVLADVSPSVICQPHPDTASTG
jgi:hypothetical protein